MVKQLRAWGVCIAALALALGWGRAGGDDAALPAVIGLNDYIQAGAEAARADSSAISNGKIDAAMQGMARLWLDRGGAEKLSARENLLAMFAASNGLRGSSGLTVTLEGREDLAAHFLVGIGLGLTLDSTTANGLARMKEERDSQPGGSGYDYTDLAAGFFGIRLGALALSMPQPQAEALLRQLAAGELKFTSLCPMKPIMPKLGHLQAGIMPDPGYDKKMSRLIDHAWKSRLASLPSANAGG